MFPKSIKGESANTDLGKMKKQDLIEFGLSVGSYATFVKYITQTALNREQAMVCVANVHMFVETRKNKAYQCIVKNADIVTPDGKPLTWALRILYGIRQERVAGMDLFPSLLKASEEAGVSVYFYGGTNEMLQSVIQKAKNKFPSLHISGVLSPPFRPLSEEEQAAIIQKINNAEPHLVFVALGCPKQEIWMHEMKGKIKSVMIGVGGALPVFSGMQKRAPGWMQRAGLEWLFRLYQEPGRLFKRYAITNSVFLWLFCKEFFQMRILNLNSNTHPKETELNQ